MMGRRDEHRGEGAATARAVLWVAAVLCVAYLPLFFGQIVFYRDPAHWNYPARFFVRAAVLRGQSPFWNPLEGLGLSTLASPLYGLFYPPNWLYLVTPRALVASMVTWQAFAHLVGGSAGVVVLARKLRLPPTAAGIAGVTWGLSGYTTSAWTAGLLLLSGAWLPWCGAGFVSLARRARDDGDGWRRGLPAAVAPLGMAFLFGEVFAALLSAIFAVAMAALALHIDGALPRPRWRHVAGSLALALALAAGIGAIVVVPARAIAAATLRGQPLPASLAEQCSLHPLRLLEMAAPGSMGYPNGEYPAGPIVGEPMIGGWPLFYSVYLGGAALVLALCALGRGRRMAALLGGGAVVAILVSLGRHTPVHGWWRAVVRPLAYMRYPEKYLVWLVALVSLLAGAGAARVLSDRPAPWRRTLVAFIALLAFAAVAPALFPPHWSPYVRWGAIKSGFAVALVLAVMAGADKAALLRRLAPVLLAAGVSLDLAIAAWPYLAFAPRAIATDTPPTAAAVLADAGRRPDAVAPPRVYRADRVAGAIQRQAPPSSEAQTEQQAVASLIGNTVTTFGIATLPGYDAAIPQLLPDLWLSGQHVGQAVLRLLGIGYVVLPIDDPHDPVEHRSGLDPMLDPLPGARLYRVPASLPRVYLAGRAQVLADEAARVRLFDPDIVEGRGALLAPSGGALPLSGPPLRVGACALISFANTEVVARCRADREAVAVFLEQHDVGWRARVDGADEPLLRANLLMRAVRLPPGEHTIVLSYAPPGLRTGALLALCALVTLAALALFPAPRARPAHTSA